jgi:hypothetical protein
MVRARPAAEPPARRDGAGAAVAARRRALGTGSGRERLAPAGARAP